MVGSFNSVTLYAGGRVTKQTIALRLAFNCKVLVFVIGLCLTRTEWYDLISKTDIPPPILAKINNSTISQNWLS